MGCLSESMNWWLSLWSTWESVQIKIVCMFKLLDSLKKLCNMYGTMISRALNWEFMIRLGKLTTWWVMLKMPSISILNFLQEVFNPKILQFVYFQSNLYFWKDWKTWKKLKTLHLYFYGWFTFQLEIVKHCRSFKIQKIIEQNNLPQGKDIKKIWSTFTNTGL